MMLFTYYSCLCVYGKELKACFQAVEFCPVEVILSHVFLKKIVEVKASTFPHEVEIRASIFPHEVEIEASTFPHVS